MERHYFSMHTFFKFINQIFQKLFPRIALSHCSNWRSSAITAKAVIKLTNFKKLSSFLRNHSKKVFAHKGTVEEILENRKRRKRHRIVNGANVVSGNSFSLKETLNKSYNPQFRV